MKTKLILRSLLVIAVLWSTSVVLAYHGGYHRGYQRGGLEERSCWTMDSAPPQAWVQGEVTARRDTTKHPLLKAGGVLVSPVRSVNSAPVTYSP